MIPTKETIKGNNYNFKILVEKLESKYLFQIYGQHIASNCLSAIMNLNFLISELIQPTLDINIDETMLLLNKKQTKRLFKKAISRFKNESWLQALEENLDEDRNMGGWNASSNL
jgi:hypothetical protein